MQSTCEDCNSNMDSTTGKTRFEFRFSSVITIECPVSHKIFHIQYEGSSHGRVKQVCECEMVGGRTETEQELRDDESGEYHTRRSATTSAYGPETRRSHTQHATWDHHQSQFTHEQRAESRWQREATTSIDAATRQESKWCLSGRSSGGAVSETEVEVVHDTARTPSSDEEERATDLETSEYSSAEEVQVTAREERRESSDERISRSSSKSSGSYRSASELKEHLLEERQGPFLSGSSTPSSEEGTDLIRSVSRDTAETERLRQKISKVGVPTPLRVMAGLEDEDLGYESSPSTQQQQRSVRSDHEAPSSPSSGYSSSDGAQMDRGEEHLASSSLEELAHESPRSSQRGRSRTSSERRGASVLPSPSSSYRSNGSAREVQVDHAEEHLDTTEVEERRSFHQRRSLSSPSSDIAQMDRGEGHAYESPRSFQRGRSRTSDSGRSRTSVVSDQRSQRSSGSSKKSAASEVCRDEEEELGYESPRSSQRRSSRDDHSEELAGSRASAYSGNGADFREERESESSHDQQTETPERGGPERDATPLDEDTYREVHDQHYGSPEGVYRHDEDYECIEARRADRVQSVHDQEYGTPYIRQRHSLKTAPSAEYDQRYETPKPRVMAGTSLYPDQSYQSSEERGLSKGSMERAHDQEYGTPYIRQRHSVEETPSAAYDQRYESPKPRVVTGTSQYQDQSYQRSEERGVSEGSLERAHDQEYGTPYIRQRHSMKTHSATYDQRYESPKSRVVTGTSQYQDQGYQSSEERGVYKGSLGRAHDQEYARRENHEGHEEDVRSPGLYRTSKHFQIEDHRSGPEIHRTSKNFIVQDYRSPETTRISKHLEVEDDRSPKVYRTSKHFQVQGYEGDDAHQAHLVESSKTETRDRLKETEWHDVGSSPTEDPHIAERKTIKTTWQGKTRDSDEGSSKGDEYPKDSSYGVEGRRDVERRIREEERSRAAAYHDRVDKTKKGWSYKTSQKSTGESTHKVHSRLVKLSRTERAHEAKSMTHVPRGITMNMDLDIMKISDPSRRFQKSNVVDSNESS